MQPILRTLLLTLALMLALAPVAALADDVPRSAPASNAGAPVAVTDVLRDRLFVLEHRLHALEAELMALRGRLVALEAGSGE